MVLVKLRAKTAVWFLCLLWTQRLWARINISVGKTETSREVVTTSSSAAFSCNCPPLFKGRNFRVNKCRFGGAAGHLLSGWQWQEIHHKHSLCAQRRLCLMSLIPEDFRLIGKAFFQMLFFLFQTSHSSRQQWGHPLFWLCKQESLNKVQLLHVWLQRCVCSLVCVNYYGRTWMGVCELDGGGQVTSAGKALKQSPSLETTRRMFNWVLTRTTISLYCSLGSFSWPLGLWNLFINCSTSFERERNTLTLNVFVLIKLQANVSQVDTLAQVLCNASIVIHLFIKWTGTMRSGKIDLIRLVFISIFFAKCFTCSMQRFFKKQTLFSCNYVQFSVLVFVSLSVIKWDMSWSSTKSQQSCKWRCSLRQS